ncbi:MAG: NYN domain-containing protein [Phycisphaerales bacterium]
MDIGYTPRTRLKTNVYIDGFNLYYGAVRGTPFKWLDVAKLCSLLLPAHDIHRIRYFTARVSATPANPDAPRNQHAYLRALGTVPNLSIHFGHFLTQRKWMPLVSPAPNGPALAEVWKREEKGSDVTLASHLLHDGHRNDYAVAVVVSNDSDLVEPIRLVREDLQKVVGVLNPHALPAKQLMKHAVFLKQIRAGPLGASQFPLTLEDARGTIVKPSTW